MLEGVDDVVTIRLASSFSLPSSLALFFWSLTWWLTVVGGGFLSRLSDIHASFFFAICINDSNLSCRGAQMQVWIWRRAADCSVWLVLSGDTFVYFDHYFYNTQNRLIERQNYLLGKDESANIWASIGAKNPLVDAIKIFYSLVIFANIK